jgi:hypothetical protein
VLHLASAKQRDIIGESGDDALAETINGLYKAGHSSSGTMA